MKTLIEGVQVEYEIEDGEFEVGYASLERLIESGLATDFDDAWNLTYREIFY